MYMEISCLKAKGYEERDCLNMQTSSPWWKVANPISFPVCPWHKLGKEVTNRSHCQRKLARIKPERETSYMRLVQLAWGSWDQVLNLDADLAHKADKNGRSKPTWSWSTYSVSHG